MVISKKILVSITGRKEKEWKDKLKEIEKYKIKTAALFLECFSKKQRKKLYQDLLNSNIREIPLVHLRHDSTKDELVFLSKRFKTKYFNIHESSFKNLDEFKGFYKNLYLEMNYDDCVSKSVKLNKIGGFCIDLSHFKASEEKWSKDFEYIMKRRKIKRYFVCNHVNGYSYSKNVDLHVVKSLKEFDYLKTLPKFIFGKIIAIETWNTIREQLRFKKYIIKILGGKCE